MVTQQNVSCGPKSIFLIDGNSKRQKCKNVGRMPPAVNTANYLSLYFIFLSHELEYLSKSFPKDRNATKKIAHLLCPKA